MQLLDCKSFHLTNCSLILFIEFITDKKNSCMETPDSSLKVDSIKA